MKTNIILLFAFATIGFLFFATPLVCQETIVSLQKKVSEFKSIRDYDKAIETKEKVWNLAKKEFGEEHPKTVKYLLELAYLCASKDRKQKAKEFVYLGYDIYLNSLNKNPRIYSQSFYLLTAASQTVFGNFDHSVQDKSDAIEYQKKTVQIAEKLYGAKSQSYLDHIEDLVSLYSKAKEHKKAIEQLRTTADNLKSEVENNPLPYIEFLDKIVVQYRLAKEYNTALNLKKEVIDLKETLPGKGLYYSDFERRQDRKQLENLKTWSGQKSNSDYSKKIRDRQHEVDQAKVDSKMEEFDRLTSTMQNAKDDLGSAVDFMFKFDEIFGVDYTIGHFQSQLNTNKILVRDSLPTWTESKLEQFLAFSRPWFNANYSNAVRYVASQPQIAGLVYDQTLLFKNLLLAQQTKIRNNINSIHTSKEYQEWLNQKKLLNSYYNSTVEELSMAGVNLIKEEYKLDQLEVSLIKKYTKTNEENLIGTWQNIRSKLGPDEVALEMVRFQYHNISIQDDIYYMALIIKANSEYPEIMTLKNGKELEETFLTQTQEQSLSKFTEDAYSKYWAPFQNALKGYKTIYFAPDGLYHKINLDILKIPGSNGKFLSDLLDIRRIGNTRDLIEPKKLPKNQKTAVIIGNPNFNLKNPSIPDPLPYNGIKVSTDKKWPQLAYTDAEIKAINYIVTRNGFSSTLLSRDEAVEQNVKKINGPSVLHLASHGFFNPIAPPSTNDSDYNSQIPLLNQDFTQFNQRALVHPNYEFSQDYIDSYHKKRLDQLQNHPYSNAGIVLAGANTYEYEKQQDKNNVDDGILTAYEVNSLNLQGTKLVVLSACETGLGTIRNNEGVYGLQRAFLVAGAQSIIMSLWQVQDQVSQEFFNNFYINWLERGMDKRDAFNATRDQIKLVWKDARYWGAFIFIGI